MASPWIVSAEGFFLNRQAAPVDGSLAFRDASPHPPVGDRMMQEKLVALARFTAPFEAEAAKNRLEAEGIPVFMQGDITVGALAGLGGIGGMIELEVFEEDRERAAEILRQHSDEMNAPAEHEDDEVPPAPDSENITPRPPAHWTHADDGLAHAQEDPFADTEDDHVDEVLDYKLSLDAIATRAWRAAVLGLFLCPPLLHLYSLWTLARLAMMPGELSPAGLRKVYFSLLIDGVVVVVTGLFIKLIVS